MAKVGKSAWAEKPSAEWQKAAEDAADLLQPRRAAVGREEPVVADVLYPRRQNVTEEAVDELQRRQREHLPLAPLAVVFVEEPHLAAVVLTGLTGDGCLSTRDGVLTGSSGEEYHKIENSRGGLGNGRDI